MQKTSLFLCLLSLILTCPPTVAVNRTEVRKVVFAPADGQKVHLLQPDGSIAKTITLGRTTVPTRRCLRVVGGIRIPAPYRGRGEEMFRQFEYHIDDNLDSVVRKKDRYSLYFKGEDNNFERHAYYRVPGHLLHAGQLTATLPVVRKQLLAVSEGGDFGLEIALYFNKQGRAADDIYDRPDSVLFVAVPEGSGKSQDVTRTFTLPGNVACALLRVGGTHFSGECWVEAPRLSQGKKAVCHIPFTRFAQKPDERDYWVGVNLATRSWPLWKLDFNGQTAFQGNIFDRSSNVADFYIPLPRWVQGSGELKLTLVSEPHRANYPYEIRSIELLEEPARRFEVIATPRYVAKDSPFGLLVETNEPNVRLRVKTDGEAYPLEQECVFAETGLHVIELRAGRPGGAVALTFDDGQRTERDTIAAIIDKAGSPVYLSCGDDIYVDKDTAAYDRYFKWYVSHRVGNWMQFRPSYQWSGLRVIDPAFIRHYTGLLNRLQMPYAWQVEGRALAGNRLNPTADELASPLYRGMQAHENDGGYYYWHHFLYKGLYSDMAARNRPYGGIFAKHRPIYTDHGVYIHRDDQAATDMADGARRLVANFRYSKGPSTRHTGPSTLFRYLYQAGYEWLGAEQMYGPEEIILSALRGASRAYSRTQYGTLHAMQWGSGPFTDPKHALRMYMSLAVAYMHGSSHLNTEDALWTDEYANDRFSVAGRQHMAAQHQMLDYLETHTRRGKMKSNIAIVQGRNCPWKSFGRDNLWAQEDDKWKFNKACESFDLLSVFYPDNTVNGCGPDGWFTSTPYGTVDLLPVEAPQDVLDSYKAVAFLGWNTYDTDDFRRLRDYVEGGGTLLLSAAHLNAELQPHLPTQFPADDTIIRELLGDNYRQLTVRTEVRYGRGKVIYFPQNAYPAEESLRSEYENTLREIAARSTAGEDARGWMEAAPSVGFTVWDTADRRTIYLLNTDWKSDKEETTATLTYQGRRFPVTVRRFRIETIHCADGLAVLPSSNTTDVLSITPCPEGWNIKVQTTGADRIQCMNALNGTAETLQLDEAGIYRLTVNR